MQAVPSEGARALFRWYAGPWMDTAESRGALPWPMLNKANFEGTVTKIPSREEIALTVNEQLVVELYAK